MRLYAVALSQAVLVLLVACGDDETSGTGGGGSTGDSSSSGTTTATTTASSSSTGGSVLGTTHEGTCMPDTWRPFDDACRAEGGTVGDFCQGPSCRYGGTCFPPPAPTEMQFACDGLFVCEVGEMCQIQAPPGDGCYEHTCQPIPDACVADPSCACIEAAVDLQSCDVDGAGNPTVTAPFSI